MKLLFLFLFISVNLSPKRNHHFFPRKLQEDRDILDLLETFSPSTKLDDKLILVGFGNFQNLTGKIQFDIFFKKCGAVTNFTSEYLKFNITLNNKNNEEIICEENITYLGKETDALYSCIHEVNYTGNVQIESRNNFQFFNETNNTNNIKIFSNLKLSSLANETYKTISKQTENLEYITFYVDNITLINNTYTLKGNMSEYINSSYAYLNLNNKLTGCSVINETIKFNPINDINDHLDLKVANPSDSDEFKILILTNKNVNDSIIYKTEDLFVEFIGFGNFKHEKNKNATTQVYLRGSTNYLKVIKYINFTVWIKLDSKKLRRLQQRDDLVFVNAFGELDDQKKTGINIYNVTLLGTENKNIIAAVPNRDLYCLDSNQFQIMSTSAFGISDGGDIDDYNIYNNESFWKYSEYFGLLNNESQTPITMSSMGTINKKYYSLDFVFNIEEELDLKKNGTTAYLNYPKNLSNLAYDREEISCSIFNITSSYKLICKPKKSIYTEVKYIRIIVPLKKSTLRFLDGDSYINRSIYPPVDSKEIIDIDVFNNLSYRKSSGGLSAGAIVAIVLSCVAAIAIVVVIIIFLNIKAKPNVKNIKDINVDNSTYKVNN